MRVLDYSAGFPGAKAIKEAGYAGAVRYIGTPGNPKCATKAELEDFDRHGLGMALVFEQTAGQWRNGFEQGKRDAQLARDHADAIGWPRGRPIYMAIDQDVVTEAEFRAMGRYLDGAGEVLGRDLTGPYGEYEVCRRSAEWGFPWQWQCRAWSGIAVIQHFQGRRLYQYFGHPDGGPNPEVGGVDCDVNEVNHPDWGQHNYEGDDMGLNADQQAALLEGAAAVREGKEGVRPAGELYLLELDSNLRLQRIEQQNQELLGRPVADVDEAALAAQLLQLGLGRELGKLPQEQLELLAKTVNDEADRRARARANVPVPAPEKSL